MTATKSKTHECQEVRWLWCRKCDGGVLEYGTHEDICKDCDGTGLRFPMLSQENRGIDRKRGRGRVPVDTLETWLSAAEMLGKWEMSKEENGYYAHIQMPMDFCSAEKIPTILAAVQQALCKATEQHQEEANDTT